MSWLLLALSLAIFCVAWSVHSPIVMALCLVAALAALGGFAWLRYKLLFPGRAVVIDDTPLTVEDVRRMRDAQAAAAASSVPASLPAAANPDVAQLRAAAERVAESDAPPPPRPNLRDEGWNPYAGEVRNEPDPT